LPYFAAKSCEVNLAVGGDERVRVVGSRPLGPMRGRRRVDFNSSPRSCGEVDAPECRTDPPARLFEI